MEESGEKFWQVYFELSVRYDRFDKLDKSLPMIEKAYELWICFGKDVVADNKIVIWQCQITVCRADML